MLTTTIVNNPIKIQEAQVFFDLHGVLISKSKLTQKYDKYVIEFLESQELIPKNVILKSVQLANQDWVQYWQKAKNYSDDELIDEYERANALWVKTLSHGTFTGDNRQLAEFLEYFIPTQFCCSYPEVKEELSKLKDLGVKMSVSSSAFTRHTLGVLVGCVILNFFQKIIGLDNTQALKSQIKYYQKALEITQTKPHNAIFLGNSFVEASLPKSLGAKVIFVNREFVDSQNINQVTSVADFVVNDLKGLSKKLLEQEILY